MFNFIALLGWSPKGEDEIFNQDQLIEIFDVDRLSTSPASFDQKKLEWINNTYMKAADLDRVVELSLPHLQAADLASDQPDLSEAEWLKKLLALYHDEMSYGAQIVDLAGLFFNDHLTLDQAAKDEMSADTALTVVDAMEAKLQALSEAEFTADRIKPLFKEIQKETGIKGRKLFMPIRIATSGQMHGPELANVLEVLGKAKVLDHISQVKGQL